MVIKKRRKDLGKWPTLQHSQGWNAAVGDNCIVAWRQECGMYMWSMNVMQLQCATRGPVAQRLALACGFAHTDIRLSFNCVLV